MGSMLLSDNRRILGHAILTNFNCKRTFCIVLLALADASYKFIYVDVGCNGRVNDGGVSSLSTTIESNISNMPLEKVIVDEMEPLSYVIVADDSFSLIIDLMKPYPFRNLSPNKIIFNYRLSRAGRIAKNAFGIMANRFRVLYHQCDYHPKILKG